MNREILIIRLSSIGDVIHCTPVAGALKEAWPGCRITWLVGENSASVIQHNPLIDEVVVWSRERFEKCLRAGAFREAWAMWRQLKADLAGRAFYAALDVHGLFLTGMIMRLVKAKHRIGLSGAKELNPLFMTSTGKPLGRHITEKYLGVVTALDIKPGCPRMTLTIPPAARQSAAAFLAAAGITAEAKIAILVPGTTWITKNWLPELFAETARLLAGDFTVMLCGGKAELPFGQAIEAAAGVPLVNAIGRTSLLEMGGLLERAAVVVGGDTGPIHMAAALGTPTVALFGPTDPAVYKPPGERHAAVVAPGDCVFCHKMKCRLETGACMKAIRPEDVVRQICRVTAE